MDTTPENEILNASLALGSLSRQREGAIADYDRIKSTLSDEFCIIGDSEYFASALYAFNKRNGLVEQVFKESKKVFDMLPESLQFGMRELGKPLVLPETGRQFNVTAARCLVVKAKPADVKNDIGQASPAVPEYTYDVQIVNVSGEK